MKHKKRLIKYGSGLIVFLLLLTTLLIYLNWHNNQRDKLYPGTQIGNINLSNKTIAEAKELLNFTSEELIASGLIFSHDKRVAKIDLISNSFEPDLSYRLITFNIEETIAQLEKFKMGSFFNYLILKISPLKNNNVEALYTLEPERLQELLKRSFPELTIEPQNAFFSFEKNSTSLQINQQKIGKEINYDLVLEELDDNLKNLSNKEIVLKTRSKYPEVTANDLNNLTDQAKTIINEQGLKLIYKNPTNNEKSITRTIKPSVLVTWLIIEKSHGEWRLILDGEKIAEYLTTNISPEVDIEAIRARFEIKNGKVSAWQKGINGQKVNISSSSEKIMTEFLDGKKEVELIIEEVVSADLSAEDTYNIQEIIGTGHSNFAGSPTNRRKNIQVGAEAVNGLLLAPGEEFSLVKVLGDVSKETGYFPELVIKGNKTIPEYGGGLCQIATTIFRSALSSGLPITARRNHSYRVSYYEPAGMDAAIYIPNPDVRFINDTPNYILIQSRIKNNDIYFDFWGKSDGRIATTTKPVVYNIIKPAPTKYIETDELDPGQKKCTESAHNGADAYFDYKVIYPEGSTTTPVQERRFSSHYVPWQEVCLIGINNKETSSTTITSSTTVVIPEVASSTSQP